MNWFYKQQRQKPAPPAVQRIAWTGQAESPGVCRLIGATHRMPLTVSGRN